MLRSAVFVAVIAVVVYAIFRHSVFMDKFKSFHKHHPGICTRVKGAKHGSEDMALTSDGLVFITSGISFPRVEEHFLKTNTTSSIQLFDFKNPKAGVSDLKMRAGKDFNLRKMRPHGISILEDKVNKEHLLYVVNHQLDESLERVEKFKFKPKSRLLTHMKTFVIEEVSSANDVAVVEEDKFYVSNVMLFKESVLLTQMQLYIPLPLGGMFFFDGTNTTNVAPSLVTPNGNCLSNDKRFLYVATTFDETLTVYERNTVTNAIKPVQRVHLFTKPDNIHLSQEGDALLIGCIPLYHKEIDFLLSSISSNSTCSSSVLRLPLRPDGLVDEANISELFHDHGDLIASSSVATQFDDQLLIGSVADSLVLCQMGQTD